MTDTKQKPSELDRASNYGYWCKYVDPLATFSEQEFDAMTLEQRLALVREVQ